MDGTPVPVRHWRATNRGGWLRQSLGSRQVTDSKLELDRRVAMETGEKARTVSIITQTFLDELSTAIASGRTVQLYGFGTFTLRKMNGAPPPHKRFGGTQAESTDTRIRFRVQFSKSDRLKKAVWKKYKENQHGKVWRRRVGGPSGDGKSGSPRLPRVRG